MQVSARDQEMKSVERGMSMSVSSISPNTGISFMYVYRADKKGWRRGERGGRGGKSCLLRGLRCAE